MTFDDREPIHDPDAQLEREFIHQFLTRRGYDTFDDVPVSERQRLMQEASVYAAGKLAEGAARHHERFGPNAFAIRRSTSHVFGNRMVSISGVTSTRCVPSSPSDALTNAGSGYPCRPNTLPPTSNAAGS